MPAGHIPPPGSPQEAAAQQAMLRQANDEGKLRQSIGVVAPSFVRTTTDQGPTAVGSLTNVSGANPTLVVGTRRLIKISCQLTVQLIAPGAGFAAYSLYTQRDGVSLGLASGSPTTQWFVIPVAVNLPGSIMSIAYDVGPPVGSHTYTMVLSTSGTGGFTTTVLGATSPGFCLAEDIGAAPS